MTPERTRRIAIADDSPAFVAAAADYIASLPGYGLAGTVQAVSQTLTLGENALPDVLLPGLGLSSARGLAKVRRVKASPSPPAVVAMTLFHPPVQSPHARRPGADALVG